MDLCYCSLGHSFSGCKEGKSIPVWSKTLSFLPKKCWFWEGTGAWLGQDWNQGLFIFSLWQIWHFQSQVLTWEKGLGLVKTSPSLPAAGPVSLEWCSRSSGQSIPGDQALQTAAWRRNHFSFPKAIRNDSASHSRAAACATWSELLQWQQMW